MPLGGQHAFQSPSPAVGSEHDTPATMPAAPAPVEPLQSQAVPQQPVGTITWTAAEYIEHKKTSLWFLGLGFFALLLGAVVWFIARDVFLTSMVILGAATFGVYAARRPRQTTYSLDGATLLIGSRSYNLSEFRSFSMAPEGSLLAVELAPMKRFAVYTIIYCHPKDQEKVAALLSAYLPMTPPRNDLTDQLLRRIHF